MSNADDLRTRFAGLVSPIVAEPDARFGKLEVLANWLAATVLATQSEQAIDRRLILFRHDRAAGELLLGLPGIKISQHLLASTTHNSIEHAIESGIQIADHAIDSGTKLLFLGADRIDGNLDLEILVGALVRSDAASVTSNQGVSDQTWMTNVVRVRDEIFAVRDHIADPQALLTHTNSFDVAAMLGVICQAAKRATPVVLIGDAASCAALIASRVSHLTREWLIPAVGLTSPAGALAQHHLGRPPILELGITFDHDFQTPIAMTAPIIDAILSLLSTD